MSIRTRSVEVLIVPTQVTPGRERIFLRDLQSSVKTERPRFVLDCSRVWEMDTDTIHLLLSSLEEVMKFNGDVRLASLRPGAKAALKIAGIDRLFEIYTTTDAATQSFQYRPTSLSLTAYNPIFENETENAA